ncbi:MULTISPECIES: telomere-protecting terminal protein Tpg [Streptomyces]|uniref:Telomere-protecting terminal protein Tpg n=3 Tax=Streptomyces TaxID=1883 RepID=A0ABW9IYV1_STRGJ
MIDSDDTQPPAPHRNRVLDALKRAERKVFTRPAPKSAKAQMKFLYTRTKQSTKALAEQLGVSTRTVQRYRAGQQTKPQKRLRATLVEVTESQWQPQARAQARERAATSSCMMVEVTAHFRFTCTGSSDDGRERTITTPISLAHLRQRDPPPTGGRCDRGRPASGRRRGHNRVVFHGVRQPRRRTPSRFHGRTVERFPVLNTRNSEPAIKRFVSRSAIVVT